MRIGLVATKEQWNAADERFVADRKVVPKFKVWNVRLSEIEIQINKSFRNFEIDSVDWAQNQFESISSSKGKVKKMPSLRSKK